MDLSFSLRDGSKKFFCINFSVKEGDPQAESGARTAEEKKQEQPKDQEKQRRGQKTTIFCVDKKKSIK